MSCFAQELCVTSPSIVKLGELLFARTYEQYNPFKSVVAFEALHELEIHMDGLEKHGARGSAQVIQNEAGRRYQYFQ